MDVCVLITNSDINQSSNQAITMLETDSKFQKKSTFLTASYYDTITQKKRTNSKKHKIQKTNGGTE